MGRARAPPKKPQYVERDDDASDPYSDEMDVSSPEFLEMGDDGEVVKNSDWNKRNGKAKKAKAAAAQDSDGEDEDEGLENQEDASDRSEDQNDENEWESEDEELDSDEEAKRKLNTVSFASLAKAQDSLAKDSKKRKRSSQNDETEQKLDALRKRLKEIQESKGLNAVAPRKKNGFKDEEQDEVSASNSENDSDDNESDAGPKKNRSSKHAPTAISSKKAVTRRRAAMEVPKAKARDPRFDSVGGVLDHSTVRKNYSFLDSYVDDEIKDLKTKLKDQKARAPGSKNQQKKKGIPKLSEEEVEGLKRELIVKESRKKQQDRRDRAEEVIKEHKKKEKELVLQGKKPYFMKNSDVKKQTLVKQFEGMSEGKREKLMEKKRRRVSQKERKGMPFSRRNVD